MIDLVVSLITKAVHDWLPSYPKTVRMFFRNLDKVVKVLK